MSIELDAIGSQETEAQNVLGVAIVSLYGYPQKHDSEPFAAQTLKSVIDNRFTNNSVNTGLYLIGCNTSEDVEQEVSKLAETLVADNNIRIIGVSIPQGTYQTAEKFLSKLDELNFKGLKVLGHALPTYLPDDFIRNFPDVLIVRGWGEESFCKIIEKELKHSRDYTDVPNLTYVRGEKVVNNGIFWPESFVQVDRFKVSDFFPRVEASRGCHHNSCTFCTRPLRENSQPSWVRVPPDIVIRNIGELKKQGVNNFTFTDEDFIGNDLEGALEIVQGVQAIGGLNFALDLRADSIVNSHDSPDKAKLRDQLIRSLVQSGLSLAYVGVETLSGGQLKRYGKGVTPDEEITAVNKLIELSVPLELGLITFDPMLSITELSENVINLRKSGLWKYGGQLFNDLHVFEGNPYCTLLKNNKLNINFNPDYLTYSYKYLNADVEQIRNLCVPFKNKADYVYTSARNIFRTSFVPPDFVEEFLLNYRENEICTLERLVIKHQNSRTVFNEAYNKLHIDIYKLGSEIKKNGFATDPKYAEVVTNISRYIREFNIKSGL